MEAPVDPLLAMDALADAVVARLLPRLADAIVERLGDQSQERLLTIQEAADALSVSPRTVRRLLGTGKLRSVVVGGVSRRIPSGAIGEYLAATGSPSPPRALPRPAA